MQWPDEQAGSSLKRGPFWSPFLGAVRCWGPQTDPNLDNYPSGSVHTGVGMPLPKCSSASTKLRM